jgi:hypothetical protein
MSKRQRYSKLSLWLRWVAALTLAGILAATVVYLTAGPAGGALFLPGVLTAVCIAAALETWVLSQYLGHDRWYFFTATAIGAGWGALAMILLGVAGITGWGGPLGSLSVQYALPLGGALFGALLGAAQWLVLRRHPGRTDLWIASQAVAGLAAATLIVLISNWLSSEPSLSTTLQAAAPASVVAGVISGFGVVRLTTR